MLASNVYLLLPKLPNCKIFLSIKPYAGWGDYEFKKGCDEEVVYKEISFNLDIEFV